MDIKELLAYCDHTLLRVDCTEAEIRKLCDHDKIRLRIGLHPALPRSGRKALCRRQNEDMHRYRLPERLHVLGRKGL